jgi:hypothetical protein
MGKRDRERKERIRAGAEAPIAHRLGHTPPEWAEWEEWDELEGFDEIPPVSYLRRFLDGEGIPYQIRGESCPAHPDQWGEGVVFNASTRDEAAEFIRRATEKWVAEGRPC